MSDEAVCSFRVRVNLVSKEDCLAGAAAQFNSDPAVWTFEKALWALLVNPANSPSEAGYQLLAGRVDVDGDVATVTVNALVKDSEALYKEASEVYAQCWGGASIDDQEASVETWLYEVLVASNASPAPCDVGYEIVSMTPVTHTPLAPYADPDLEQGCGPTFEM